MKTARIVILFIAVVVVLTVGYFGANLYMQNMAIKKINNTIKKNHWENLVEYGKVKANILSGTISVQNVKFTVQNSLTKQTLGVLSFKKIALKGDLNKNYDIAGYDISYLNLNPKLPEFLANKTLLNAKMFNFSVHKKENIVDKLKGKIEDIMISKTVMNAIKDSNNKNLENVAKIVKINNPINIEMNYKASIDKGTLDIKKYSIDFVNNIGISYKAKIENVDFKGLQEASKELKKNPKDFVVIANVLNKLMKLKITKFDFSIYNYGLIDRIIDYAAKKKNKTKQAFIEEILEKAQTIPISSAYPAIKNFIESHSKKLSIDIKNKQKLSIDDIIAKIKNKENILNILKIKFSN